VGGPRAEMMICVADMLDLLLVFLLAQVVTQFPLKFVQIFSRGFCTREATKLVSGVFVKRKKNNNVYVDPPCTELVFLHNAKV
jgi:hypothetical protein